MKRILIASPVKQKPAILAEFLDCLLHLDTTDLSVDYLFIDDQEEPCPLLRHFVSAVPRARLLPGDGISRPYHCSEKGHCWEDDIIWKVARYKNIFIEQARNDGYDFLFLPDSDLALHPQTLRHLAGLNLDIVSEVFWTRWEPELPPLPQVWAGGQYRLFAYEAGEDLTPAEIGARQADFLSRLLCPGTYPVGGLGACTLLSKKALQAGVSFTKIPNLDLTGEDRHFCVRAAVLGFSLYADTHYPPYHMYRESELAGLGHHKKQYNYAQRKAKPRLTLGMLVRNEAGRYLEKVLTHAASFADEVIILDDASTDDTVSVCRRCLSGIPHRIVVNETPGFHNEILLRKQLWQLITATRPDWILILDADEIFEDLIKVVLPCLLHNPDVDAYYFRLYDMWNETHFREDRYWQAHLYYRPFLIRYLPDYDYQWRETALHCGRLPANILSLRGVRCPLRLKHLGWSRAEDRLQKYQRYLQLDPEGYYGNKEQYLSILDPQPNLLPWREKEGLD